MKPIDDLTAQCIRCGFCLDVCPTFKLTGSELESPRGRIYLARSAAEGALSWEDGKDHFERCLGCLACEPACPSAVQYGEIIEIARSRVAEEAPSATKELLVDAVTNPALMKLSRFAPRMKAPAGVMSPDESEADLPRPERGNYPPLAEPLPPVVGEVYLLEGCAMRELFPRVHLATRRLLRRVGYVVRESNAGCCGSMHAHNGFLEAAAERAEGVMASMVDPLPVVVNSAGCGSTMKRYPELVPGSESFSDRVTDISDFLLRHGLLEALKLARGLPGLELTYHDACHLAHGQRIKESPRTLLQAIPGVHYLELGEADLCCGSAGIYNALQPKMARQLLDRKLDHIAQTQATVVALGNPGCHAWIAQGLREQGKAVVARHTAEVLEAAFLGPEALN